MVRLVTRERRGADSSVDAAELISSVGSLQYVPLIDATSKTVHVRSYGAVGDGTTDDTAAIDAAIAAVGTCGTVVFDALPYLFTTLTDTSTNRVVLRGQGWWTVVAADYADAQYATLANFTGTRLISTASSGSAIASTGAQGRLDIEDIAIIGPGSGTSIGVELAHATLTSSTRSRWKNVAVCNFKVGVQWAAMLGRTYDLVLLGNATGIKFVNSPNANQFYNTEITGSTTRGVDGSAGTLNSFVGGTFQGNSGTVVYLAGAQQYRFYDIYFENAGATYAVDGGTAPNDYHCFDHCHWGGAGDVVNITGNNWQILWPQSVLSVLTPGAFYTLIGNFGSTINGNAAGDSAIIMNVDAAGHVTRLPDNDVRLRTGRTFYFEDSGTTNYIKRDTGTGATEIGGEVKLIEAGNLVLGTASGSKIGTATTQKLAFWNATPVVQPAANADTSGATLGQLETEVNELKALLRTVGLMAP